jgi:hypothetical protein
MLLLLLLLAIIAQMYAELSLYASATYTNTPYALLCYIHMYMYALYDQAVKRARLRDHEERVALSGECDAAKKRVAAAARLRGLCVTRHRYLAWVGRQDCWEVSCSVCMYAQHFQAHVLLSMLMYLKVYAYYMVLLTRVDVSSCEEQ